MKKNKLHLLALPALFALSSGALACLVKDTTQVKADNSFIVTSLTTSNGLMSASDWAGLETYAMDGPNGGSVAFASIGTNFFFRMEISDTTPNKNKEKIDFTFAVDGKSQGQQGNFDPWLTGYGAMDFGDNVQTELSYDEDAQKFVAVIGFNMGSSFVSGAKVSTTIHFYDATEASQGWGSGVANTFSSDLYLLAKGEEEEVAHTYIVNNVATSGLTTDADWVGVETYEMIGENKGTVAFLASGTKLFFRMEMPDTTPNKNKEKIDYLILAGGKTHGQQGNFDPWLTGNVAMEFGDAAQVELSYDSEAQKYIAVIGMEMGSTYAKGLKVNATVNYHDATEVTQEWGTGNANTFNHDLWLEEFVEEGEESSPEESTEPETPSEGLVEGPANTDLGIVVEDLAKIPNDAAWEKATAYEMIPVYGDTTGATGTIKIYSSNENFFWRMDVKDPTVSYRTDGIYIKVSTADEEPRTLYEGRGNFDNWIAEKSNELGQPSLREDSFSIGDITSFSEGVITHKEGFYAPNYAVPGRKLHFEIRFRDSRSSHEPWIDDDQIHTIYFDQVVTFGEKADTSIRPETPTEGFVGDKEGLAYNKVTIKWNEAEGADTYKLFLYQKTEEGWTYLRTEGPIYAGDDSYAEEITGLSEQTEYAVQVIAYDVSESMIAASDLVLVTTPSRNPSTSEPPVESSEEIVESSEEIVESSEEAETSNPGTPIPEKKGCGGSVIAASSLIGVVLCAGAALLVKRFSKKD
ncbi:MAG: hypothetical protein SPG64_05785 [Candidatus Enteromonas sp.]|nr:hypothetical protein [Candidatus Enteromonas sp.]